MKLRYLVPIAVLAVLAVFLGLGLNQNPNLVPSPLIGKSAPVFNLPEVAEPARHFQGSDLRGKVWLLNVWASWCVACRDEHQVLLALNQSGQVPIYGMNYKDTRTDALRWLAAAGDPYVLSVSDASGAVGMDFGVYGVPETYLIDRHGVIRYKQIGPLTPDVVERKILPLVAELSR